MASKYSALSFLEGKYNNKSASDAYLSVSIIKFVSIVSFACRIYKKRRCGMIANETTIHKRPK